MVRYSKLMLDEHGKPTETDVRDIAQETMLKCPHAIMLPDHYREDETCRCNDPTHTEMKDWGYEWDGSMWV